MFEQTMDMLGKVVTSVTDEMIAVSTTLGVLYMVANGIVIPEFLVVAYAMMVAFYFKK